MKIGKEWEEGKNLEKEGRVKNKKKRKTPLRENFHKAEIRSRAAF